MSNFMTRKKIVYMLSVLCVLTFSIPQNLFSQECPSACDDECPSACDSNYVELAGDTMTGNLEISRSASDPALNFDISGTDYFTIGVDYSDTQKLKIGTTAIDTSTRVTIDNTGKIGIGTTTPSGLLHVNNGYLVIDKDKGIVLDDINGGARNYIWSLTSSYTGYGFSYKEGSPDYFAFHPGGDFDSPEMIITGNDYVGIGTTTPGASLHVVTTNSNANVDMTIFGRVTSSPANDDSYDIIFRHTNNLPEQVDFAQTTLIASSITDGAERGALAFSVISNGSMTEQMRVAYNGIGIGTTNPQNKLDIEGAVSIGASYSGSSTAPSNGMIIEGDLGVGTTSPSGKIGIDGGTYQANPTNYTWPCTCPSGYTLIDTDHDSACDDNECYRNGLLVNNGNTGIGTISPKSALDVNISSQGTDGITVRHGDLPSPAIWIRPDNDATYYANPLVGTDGAKSIIFSNGTKDSTANDNELVIGPWTDESGRGIVIKGDGKLGVGTESPTSTLDVNGDIEIPSDKYIYFGDPTTSGSIRMYISSGNIYAQKYNGSDWTTNGAKPLTDW